LVSMRRCEDKSKLANISSLPTTESWTTQWKKSLMYGPNHLPINISTCMSLYRERAVRLSSAILVSASYVSLLYLDQDILRIRDLSCVSTLDRPSSLPQETRELWPAVTISAPARGDLGGQVNVERNVIVKLSDTEPDFLMEFRTKLRQRRWIDSDTVCFFFNHIPLVIENYRRTLLFSGMNFTDSTTIFKPHPRAPCKETVFPANVNCIILYARFYTAVGRRTTSSKRIMSGGSLTSWGYTSIWFLVQGKATHCGCCYYSII
jgi:hypothetical protein